MIEIVYPLAEDKEHSFKNLRVAGDFSHWEAQQMCRDAATGAWVFPIDESRLPGVGEGAGSQDKQVLIHFKFIDDQGRWFTCEEFPEEPDEHNNMNNVKVVHLGKRPAAGSAVNNKVVVNAGGEPVTPTPSLMDSHVSDDEIGTSLKKAEGRGENSTVEGDVSNEIESEDKSLSQDVEEQDNIAEEEGEGTPSERTPPRTPDLRSAEEEQSTDGEEQTFHSPTANFTEPIPIRGHNNSNATNSSTQSKAVVKKPGQDEIQHSGSLLQRLQRSFMLYFHWLFSFFCRKPHAKPDQ